MVLKRLLLSLCLPFLLCGAVEFDGTDDKLQVDNPDVGDATFTSCTWVYATSWGDTEGVFSYANGNDSGAGRGWSMNTNTDTSIRMRFFDGGGQVGSATTGGLSTSTWIHVCFVRSGTFDNPIYVDGVEVGTFIVDPPPVQNSTDDIIIAGPPPAATAVAIGFFAGRLAYTGYWNSILSEAQILSMADKSTCPTDVDFANLEFFATLDDVSDLEDLSSNAFTITASGGPTTVAGPTGMPCAAPAPANNIVVLEDY